ncbi:MAG: peptide-methionine (R)-S-oxide reductase MsrB [Porticoccaceae bacterium]|nr:peptide-methionine (R)-S-oxide reductase MsrB [Porticoccaceae bacterium]
MNRRTWLQQIGLGVLAMASSTKLWALEKLELADSVWKRQLTEGQYDILRDEGTEPAGSSPLNNEHRDGLYQCAGCELPLFTSAMKYESGTGWPSFFTHIDNHLETKRDFKLIWPRLEYHCARCGGHQGHVFDDGPKPTGQRWCNNGLALVFVPNA